MAILTSSKGFTYDTESGVRTNPDKTTTQIKSIKTSDLEGEETPTLPEPKVNDYSGLISSIDNTLTSAKKDAEIEDFYRNQRAENQKIFGLMSDVGQEDALTKKYGMEEGAFDAKKQYNDYVSQIESEQKALRDQTEKIRKNLTGALDIGVQSQISELERKSLSKQADLAILQNAASKRYSTAMEIARNKVEMELAPKKAELEAYKFIIENNKPFQTAEFNSILKNKEREIEREQKRMDTGNEMIVNAISFSAPNNIIEKAKTALKNGADVSSISRILGNYSGDYYKAQLLKEQIETERAQRENIKTKTEIEKVSTKPATQSQYTAAGYASRVVQAKDIVDKNQSELIKLSVSEQAIQRNLPNFLKSPLMQSQEQAERNFINAVLRRESGAAIADSEFENAEKQYFPRPGDSAEVLLQKKQNRDLVSSNIIKESGSAYTQQTTTNKFSEALGKTNEKIPGTSIVSSVSNGIINFNIPNKK